MSTATLVFTCLIAVCAICALMVPVREKFIFLSLGLCFGGDLVLFGQSGVSVAHKVIISIVTVEVVAVLCYVASRAWESRSMHKKAAISRQVHHPHLN